ncbi:unnamed protein product [Plutella xylostella]|uniref:(diamondback moth) hypothetical protein n=1 Tax=Plutella xylostella TaxID=51655 RepID=A0A8S4D2E1_PLUXY|nr:unnamed protein product [Plutella xylostella]
MIEQINAKIDLKERKLSMPDKELLIFHMTDDDNLNIQDLCNTYNDLFTEDVTNSATTNVKHKINLINNEPIYQRPFRLPQVQQEEIKKQVDKLLNENIIRPSESPWASPVHIIKKKLDQSGVQKWRMVIDYRRLNEMTKSDKFPLPNIEELFSKLQGNNYFSTLDLTSGYHQILMDDSSIEATAFSTPDGHYEFLRMPFGLKNAPATFQRMMNNVLKEEIAKNVCLVYLDDIIIYSENKQDHINKLQQVFEALRRANLKVNKNKCVFMEEEIEFLGHILNKNGLKPNQKKIDAIRKFPIPKTLKEIRGFLGLIGYYRKFVPGLSKIVKPLTEATKKNATIDINNKQYLEAIETCKHLLTNAPILAFPDFNKTFVITTDASDIAIGAVLSQNNHPIAYASRTLSSAEQKYNTTEKELLGILWAVTHFRPYVYGRKFTLRTDHKALIWLSKLKEPNQRLTRWKLKLQDYDFNIEHVKGKDNHVADALSRVEIHHTDGDSLEVNCENNSQQSELASNSNQDVEMEEILEISPRAIYMYFNKTTEVKIKCGKHGIKRLTTRESEEKIIIIKLDIDNTESVKEMELNYDPSKISRKLNQLKAIEQLQTQETHNLAQFVDRIREEYEFWLVQVFGLTGIQICMNMYQIITSDAAEVSNSAYCAGWEQLADSGVRRSIAIMIARAQIPVQVQALNMVTFNMELFVSVMQTSYSVFTLLRS